MRNEVPAPLPVTAVDRALRLLIMLRQQGALSVTAAAESLDVAPSTAHRLLSALCHRGFAVQDRERRYRPGPQIADPVAAPLSRAALTRVVRPALELLRQKTNETTHLAVLSGADVLFIDGVEGEHALRVGMRVGRRMPAFCSSTGKAMLASLPRVEVDQLHRTGLAPWRGTTLSLAGLHRGLETVRKQGYALNQEESEQGVVAVGACLLDGAQRPLAGMSVSIPSSRYDRSALPGYVDALHDATSEAQKRLSGADHSR
ncbi:IclR family transcriptional regulator [Geodermatophilus sabuli]|nr:IclR family transcriptional regulator [Geodermatophilus sabuli]MBB3085212.1 DNA-binding IclR family transcriptional regulator [Geodermatophilus sabuli]